MSTQKAENNRYAFCLFKVCATNFGDICHAVGQEATEKFLVCEVLPVVIANTLVRALSQAGVGVCVCLIRRNGSSASRALISNISTSEADVFHEGEAAGLWEGGKASPVPEGTTLGDFCCRPPPHTHTLATSPSSLLQAFPTTLSRTRLYLCTPGLQNLWRWLMPRPLLTFQVPSEVAFLPHLPSPPPSALGTALARASCLWASCLWPCL